MSVRVVFVTPSGLSARTTSVFSPRRNDTVKAKRVPTVVVRLVSPFRT